jgi:hypothetical protein
MAAFLCLQGVPFPRTSTRSRVLRLALHSK